MPDTFDSLRPRLPDYLRGKGIDPGRRFRCLNPQHDDRHPSMGYDPKREKVHCFACEADYDLFDLLAIEESLPSPKAALERARRLYGVFPENEPKGRGAASGRAAREGAAPEAQDSDSYPERCFARREETSYFAERGLSRETVERFRLGYDPDTGCVVLPCDGGRYVRRSVTEKRYLNEKGRPAPLFQADALRGQGPVFVVEGIFDALAVQELGWPACAMNGAGNRERVAEILRELPENSPVLLLPDNDRAGEQWADALLEAFPWLYRCPALPEGKDINEYLLADRQGARRFLEQAAEAWREHAPAPYEAASAAGRMEGLLAYIQAQAERPALRTGFNRLDRALDGGLYDGLYVLGAVSSLGKTAFCMQIADQLAQQGQDVLVFSLEMSAYELMARSISRESFLLDETPRHHLAKTVRGVLDGRRYAGYSAQERAHLERATAAYAAYGGHLYLREGGHGTGLELLRREILRHVEETGRRPVVLIDYLQIVAPDDPRSTDKQNLDRIVCALKRLSREHTLTILAISSFNRENYHLEASMSAFKESGGIDYSADVLIGLQARGAGGRSFNLEEEKRKDPRELELKILKNRSAAIPEPIVYRYYPAYSCFEE